MQDLINNLTSNSIKINSSSLNCGELIEEAVDDGYKSTISSMKEDNDDYISSIKSDTSKSECIIQGSISLSLKDNNFFNTIIYGMMYCPECMIPCSVIFNDNFTVSFDCGCFYIKNISIKEFMNDYMHKEKHNYNEYNMYCKLHQNQTKFNNYCTDCGYDLCIECMDDKYISDTKKIIAEKRHENHTLINLDDIIQKFPNLDKLMEKYENQINFFGYNNDIKQTIRNVFRVINCIMENYKLYKCYNLYKSIINAENFLIKINDFDNFVLNMDNSKYRYEKLIKITSKNELDKNIINSNFRNKIYSINIKQNKTGIDLTIFQGKKFINLKELILPSNNCFNIENLFSCEFPVLQILDLEVNGINDSIIELFEKVNFPQLIYLNLFSNQITSIKLFDLVKKFKKIKNFFVGGNKFDINNNPKSYYEFPESMEEFGMTSNFEGEEAKFIKKLGIENLKIFYFSKNQLKTLKYLENIKFKRLEEFWSTKNNLTDIKELKYLHNKENLKIVNLKENKICNFNELFDIIHLFPKIEKLNLKGNNIEESDALLMKKRIKEKYCLEFEIII